jgi:peptidyl-prolyl cis-trans isomerase C
MRASTLAAVGIGLLLIAWQARPVLADTSPAETTVVARIGTRTITVDELSRRIASIPPFQLRAFGHNAEEVRRNFLQKVLVREALLAQGALGAKLEDRDDVRERIRGVLRSTMLSGVRAETISRSPVSDEEVKRYYDANPTKFHTPARMAIWRIQVAKREEAAAILKEILAEPTPKRWNEICRDKSLDRATSMRGGNLGFVSPDGTTAEAEIKVDQAILKAAGSVEDGKIVPEPVAEGERFAVIWRRQSMKAVDRAIEIEAASIRQVLTHEKTEKRTTELIEQLRKDHLRDFNPDLVDLVDVAATGELQAVRRPGTLLPRKPGAPPTPVPGPGGLR